MNLCDKKWLDQFMFIKQRVLWILIWGILTVWPASHVWAVVGRAEKYDEFEQERLEEFQNSLLMEEQMALQKKEKPVKSVESEGAVQSSEADESFEALKLELMTRPKTKKIYFQSIEGYSFNSNVDRLPIQKEKSDSVFDTRHNVEVDLSGKKTDLRTTIEGGKVWNVHYPEKDMWDMAHSLNYRRKYFKKISHSLQTRFARQDEETIEIDKTKVRYDFAGSSTYNYPITEKASINLTFSGARREFMNEYYDEDSTIEGKIAPSFFWNFTPKSRIFLGYDFGADRIRSKVSDNNAHSLHLGYFGRLTKKSSTSFDFSIGYQTPKSLEADRVKTISLGWGYIWQWTAKTQLTVQAMRSIQNTTTNIVSSDETAVEGEAASEEVSEEPVKEDIYYTNDSLTLSINSRLTRRLTGRLSLNASHTHNETHQSGRFSENEGLEDEESTQYTFPVSVDLSYAFTKIASLNLGYRFSYRRAYEKDENFRVHELDTSLRIAL